jgi:ribonuclease BN (tRNA processing enzyme)
MPDSSPFDSTIPPYKFIRVDKFTSNVSRKPALHLLTHCHSDHLLGLDSRAFNSIVLCSDDTKRLVLNTESYSGRSLYDNRLVASKKRLYKHLCIQGGEQGRSRDLLVCTSSIPALKTTCHSRTRLHCLLTNHTDSRSRMESTSRSHQSMQIIVRALSCICTHAYILSSLH